MCRRCQSSSVRRPLRFRHIAGEAEKYSAPYNIITGCYAKTFGIAFRTASVPLPGPPLSGCCAIYATLIREPHSRPKALMEYMATWVLVLIASRPGHTAA